MAQSAHRRISCSSRPVWVERPLVLLPAVLASADVNILLEAIAGVPTACLERRGWGRIYQWRPPIFTDKATVAVAHALY
jgi:hypothetical protein